MSTDEAQPPSQTAQYILGVMKDNPAASTISAIDDSQMMIQEIGPMEIRRALHELEADGLIFRQGPIWSLTREGLEFAA